MGYWATIAPFLGFLAIFLISILAAGIVGLLLQADPAVARRLWFVETWTLLNVVVPFVLVWVLSGYWDWYLVATFIIVAHLGLGVTYVSRELMSSLDTSSMKHQIAAGAEWDTKHPRLNKFGMQIFGTATCVIYIVACGVVFFTQEPSAARTVTLLQYALVMFFITGTVTLVPVLISLTTSKNLNPEARTRIFANQIGGLLPTTLFLGLSFLAFTAPSTIEGDLRKSISWELAAQVIVVVTMFFVFVILLPHLIGTRRGQRWRADLLNRKRQLLAELTNILGPPLNAAYAVRLTELRNKIRGLIANFGAAENDPMVELMAKIEGWVQQGIQLAPADQAYYDCRGTDPRYSYLDWLRELADGKDYGIDAVIADLQSQATDKDRKDAIEVWSKRFGQIRQQLDDENKAEKEDKPLLPTFALWIAAAVVPTFVGFIAVAIWKLLVVPDITSIVK